MPATLFGAQRGYVKNISSTNPLIHLSYTLATITFTIPDVGLFPFFRKMTKSPALSPAYSCCCFRDLERGSNERVTFIVFRTYCMVDYVNPCKHGESVQAGLFFHISHICMYRWWKNLMLCYCVGVLHGFHLRRKAASARAMHCESCQVHRIVVILYFLMVVLLVSFVIRRYRYVGT